MSVALFVCLFVYLEVLYDLRLAIAMKTFSLTLIRHYVYAMVKHFEVH